MAAFVCPHCGKTIPYQDGDFFDTPFRSCPACKKEYFDPHYEEIALKYYIEVFTRRKEIYQIYQMDFTNPKSVLGTIGIILFESFMVFVLVMAIEFSNNHFFLCAVLGLIVWGIGILLFGILFPKANSKRLALKAGRKTLNKGVKQYPNNMVSSLERLSDINYIQKLQKNGVIIPEFFLKRAKKINDAEKKKSGKTDEHKEKSSYSRTKKTDSQRSYNNNSSHSTAQNENTYTYSGSHSSSHQEQQKNNTNAGSNASSQQKEERKSHYSTDENTQKENTSSHYQYKKQQGYEGNNNQESRGSYGESHARNPNTNENSTGLNFFAGCDSKEKIVTRYRQLVKIYHPDISAGDTETFKIIQAQYEKLIKETD